jgi:hypothetical protein
LVRPNVNALPYKPHLRRRPRNHWRNADNLTRPPSRFKGCSEPFGWLQLAAFHIKRLEPTGPAAQLECDGFHTGKIDQLRPAHAHIHIKVLGSRFRWFPALACWQPFRACINRQDCADGPGVLVWNSLAEERPGKKKEKHWHGITLNKKRKVLAFQSYILLTEFGLP